MRLGHNERTTSIPLNIDLHIRDWDKKNRLVKKTYVGTNSVSRLNNLIQKHKADAMDEILKLHEHGELERLSLVELRERIANKGLVVSFFDFTKAQIDELIKTGRIGTARSYKGVVDVLRTFNGGKELELKEITYKFLQRFETYHLAKGNTYNGLSVYIRAIRAIYNKAVKAGLVEKEHYPFTDYKIKSVPTEKRALDWPLLKSIIDLKLEPSHPCFHARNYFLASYMLYGMNFTDMAYLKRSDIQDGRILYRRKKTSKLYDVKITETLHSLLSHYANNDSEYVFPIIKRETALLQAKDIQWARKRYNAKLKEIAKLCGIEKTLTSYVSRHSFATQAMLKQIPLNAISTMLGHSSLKTTEIYLKSLPSNILDEYNLQITGDI